MLPLQVALVPEPKELVPTKELLYVASALQTQIARDLGPIWNVTGVVSAFEQLDDIPPGYIPLVIVAEPPPRRHGFHTTQRGRRDQAPHFWRRKALTGCLAACPPAELEVMAGAHGCPLLGDGGKHPSEGSTVPQHPLTSGSPGRGGGA